MHNFIITIPVSYFSSRLPGKPLKLINGKTMLMRVWEKCIKATKDISKVVVLTDDYRIIHYCIEKKINFYKTSKKCKTGSDRIYEFAKKFNNKKIESIPVKKIKNFPLNSSINISKLLKIFKKKIKIKNFEF